MATYSETKKILDKLSTSRSTCYLHNDPVSMCHRYSTAEDREIAGLIASSLAYGSVNIILRSLNAVFAVVGDSPRKYIENFDAKAGLKAFARFKHRFNDGRDMCALMLCMQLMIKESGSIKAYFMKGYSAEDADIGVALNRFSKAAIAFDYQPVFGVAEVPESSYFKFMFPAPSSGSACKRLCMFLRWMIRPADGIDLGIWPEVSPHQLIIPVDTHISRISRYLGLTKRAAADWRTAVEITKSLRRFDDADPVKYDFSLAHLGISDGCDGIDLSHCLTCPVSEICVQKRSK